MTKRKLVNALVVLMSCATINGFAQGNFLKGYIITLKGDTLKGEIKNNPKKEIDMYTKVYLKVSETDKKYYKPDKIKEYFVNGKTYVSRMNDGEAVFMKRISSGVVSLYEYQTVWLNKMNEEVIESEYYVEKKGEAVPTKIKSGKFKKQICEIMSDNAEIIKDIQDKKYDYENIVDVFEQYNNWAKEQNKG